MSANPDAVILGGGPAGATAALLLARAGWSVVLLEKKAFPRRKVCGEYLSAATLPLLDDLGIGEEFRAAAGPPVTRVGLFADGVALESELPRPGGRHRAWGRALGRERLDTLLLAAAARAGAQVLQPCSVLGLVKEGPWHRVRYSSNPQRSIGEFRTAIVIAAHGSWDAGALPTQPARNLPRPSDLFGFKAHFVDADLPSGLMPLLAFPGGYGGMVECDHGRVSLSCCLRRDWLALLHGRHPGEAGEAVLVHVSESCAGVRRVLRGARRLGPWLAAGPIRPGIRVRAADGLFRVGNAAGEAHPVVAEGISMAMQSASLLVHQLRAWREQGGSAADLDRVCARYAAAWRHHFAPRLHASSVVAHWAMRPTAVAAALPILKTLPALLTWCARISGKASRVIAAG